MTTNFSSRSYRNEPCRNQLIRDSFAAEVAERFKHLEPDVAARQNELWGPGIQAKVATLHCYFAAANPLVERLARTEALLKNLTKVAKRPALEAQMHCAFEGELTTQLIQMLKAYGYEKDGIIGFQMSSGFISLAEGNGWCRINKGVLFGPESDFVGYSGRVVVDKDLSRRGGPFAVEIDIDHLRLVSLNERVRRWKIAVRIVRENGLQRGSAGLADLMHRLRSNNRITFEKRNKRLIVSLAPGKADPAWAAQLKKRIARVERFRNALQSHIDSLKAIGAAEALQFCANPDLRKESERRELQSAEEAFSKAAGLLFDIMSDACYKDDLPEAPYTKMPDSFPSTKVVSRGLRAQYQRYQAFFADGWERLLAARAACAKSDQKTPEAIRSENQDERGAGRREACNMACVEA